MFSISLVLASLIAIAIVINSETDYNQSSELVSIPVRVSETNSSKK